MFIPLCIHIIIIAALYYISEITIDCYISYTTMSAGGVIPESWIDLSDNKFVECRTCLLDGAKN